MTDSQMRPATRRWGTLTPMCPVVRCALQSVKTQNEQVDREWAKEREEIRANPDAEERELASMLTTMGMSKPTAAAAAQGLHSDREHAALVHVTQELGLDPREKPSPVVAAVSSFITFSTGALVPLIPFLLGFASLAAGQALGGLGLLIAGALASLTTVMPWWLSALRQLAFGAIAAGATYLVGLAMGISIAG